MTRARVLYALLAVVATAAAVLSFAALRDLALLCGFGSGLAPLLPVVIDAGAAAGSLAWLAPWTAPAATRYGRALALVLLTASVGGNALGHGLDAYRLAPAWWVVVVVSALAPAVLGALVHLVVLVGRPVGVSPPATVGELVAAKGGEEWRGTGEDVAETAPTRVALRLAPPPPPTPGDDVEMVEVDDLAARVAEIVARDGGRRTVMEELGVSEYKARRLLDEHKARA